MLGNLISAGANLLSGFMGSKANEEARNLTQQNAANNIKLQKKFAQEGIRWKVEDAKEAGIHPLFALGAQTHSFSPQSISFSPDNAMASSVANMGQDISRAVNSTRTSGERIDAFTQTAQKLALEKGALENQLLASQIKRLQVSANPPMASGNANSVPGAPTFEEAPRLSLGSGPLAHDKTISNAEDFEKRWGEWGGDATGLYVMIKDYLANAASSKAALMRQNPIDFRARGSLRENSRRLLNRY